MYRIVQEDARRRSTVIDCKCAGGNIDVDLQRQDVTVS